MQDSTSSSPGVVSPHRIAQTKKRVLQYLTNLALYGVKKETVLALVEAAYDGV